MEKYGIGMMAVSLAGHDKGNVYLVSGVDDQYVYLVDGKNKTMENPKRKKRKHIQVDYHITEWISRLLDEKKEIQNSDVVKAIKEYSVK